MNIGYILDNDSLGYDQVPHDEAVYHTAAYGVESEAIATEGDIQAIANYEKAQMAYAGIVTAAAGIAHKHGSSPAVAMMFSLLEKSVTIGTIGRDDRSVSMGMESAISNTVSSTVNAITTMATVIDLAGLDYDAEDKRGMFRKSLDKLRKIYAKMMNSIRKVVVKVVAMASRFESKAKTIKQRIKDNTKWADKVNIPETNDSMSTFETNFAAANIVFSAEKGATNPAALATKNLLFHKNTIPERLYGFVLSLITTVDGVLSDEDKKTIKNEVEKISKTSMADKIAKASTEPKNMIIDATGMGILEAKIHDKIKAEVEKEADDLQKEKETSLLTSKTTTSVGSNADFTPLEKSYTAAMTAGTLDGYVTGIKNDGVSILLFGYTRDGSDVSFVFDTETVTLQSAQSNNFRVTSIGTVADVTLLGDTITVAAKTLSSTVTRFFKLIDTTEKSFDKASKAYDPDTKSEVSKVSYQVNKKLFMSTPRISFRASMDLFSALRSAISACDTIIDMHEELSTTTA